MNIFYFFYFFLIGPALAHGTSLGSIWKSNMDPPSFGPTNHKRSYGDPLQNEVGNGQGWSPWGF